MSKLPVAQPDEDARQDKKRAEQVADAIGVYVMNALGRPKNLFKVSVVRLWKDRYRINVQTGSDAVSTSIAHSFFVTADESGTIVESTPRITRLY